MQTETSILPVVQLNVHRTITRKAKPSKNSATLESKKLSPCRNTLFPSSKKCLNPLLGAPYRDTMKQQSLSDESKSGNKSIFGQRVMSAKMLRFKQLQNQLADAHYHLNELANENRLLKALQKRQDSALRRYEGANAELPKLINSHHEELRVLRTKYKKLKELHKDTCNLLKERENELYSANSQNKHLLQLSKDRNLEEREKLQLQLTDMNYKMRQQQETIQLLHRKLTLETKSLKHQLHIEISKHKETQKNLQETIEKLKNLECLLDNREKRLYSNGQLPIYNKEKNLGSHSLTNFSISNPIKSSNRSKRSENGPKDNLPSLDILESNDDEKVTQPNNVNHNQSVNQLKSETMASLQQIRKFRLQRSHMRKNAHSMDDLRFKSKDSEMSAHDDEKVISIDYKSILKRDELNNDQGESGKLRKLFSRIKNQNTQKLQKELRAEFDYSSDDGESGNACEYNQSYDTPQTSRELYVRLINSTDDTSDTLDDIMKKVDSNEEEEEELSTRLKENLTFQKHKSETKLLHYRKNDFYDSGSEDDVDSEGKININGDSPIEYKSNDFQTSLSKFAKEFSKSFNGVTHLEHNTLDITKQSVGRLKDAQLPRISNNTSDDVSLENAEVPQQSSNLKRTWLDKEQLLDSNGIDDSSTDMKKEDCIKKEEIKYLEEKPVYADMSCDKVYHDIDNAIYEEMKNLPTLEKKKVEKDSQEAYRKESTINHLDGSIWPVHNLEKEYFKLKDETCSVMRHSDEETSDKPGANIETQNKLNATLNVDVSQTEQSNGAKSEIAQLKQTNEKKRTINYNKEKLLATMKAIDDNDNIEFLSQGFKDHNVNRMQIMENLHRGLPAHSKPKRDIIRDIFEDNPIESKVRGTCSKSH
ncbi:PREDICTED: intracellular protein transport protein USO1 [Trachymyrmex septentrionalis]|uniref:intracellular protein transport protein USO1 n=1 Tax=Trachymyrmex septentrionalis TaxID=34720 RepID=UPI00084ED5C1|nr:PREDICTED: intracellular protein transport protein USO1 [Trachymyrmex septentrionalis]